MKATSTRNRKSYFLFTAVLFSLMLGINGYGQTQSQTFTGNGTFTVPTGVTSVTVECWGGGGAGGGVASGFFTTRAGGGGSGGTYTKATSVAVSPGTSITVTVGPGGAGVSGANGANGGTSTFASGIPVNAIGGGGGKAGNGSNSNGAGGGTATGNTYNGGTGAAAASQNSGGGGGGAGNGGSGGNASGTTGGTGGGGAIPGGAGANGTTSGADGASATALSGGGGGAKVSGGVNNRPGGNGYRGLVIVSWCITYTLTSTTAVTPICASSGTSLITVTSSAALLPVGSYTVTYSRSSPLASGLTATMSVTTAGTGTFTAIGLTTAGNATITVTNIAEGNCSTAISSNNLSNTITVNAPPSTAIAGSDQNLCNVTTTTLSGNSFSVGSGSWSVVSGTATITTPSSPTSDVTGLVIGGAATLRWTIANPPCTPSTDDVIITVNASPSITINPSTATQTICFNGNATALSVTASGAGLTYQWYSNVSATNSGGTPVGTSNPSYTPLTTTVGTLYYYCVVSGTCPSPVTSAVSGAIITNPMPDIPVAIAATNISPTSFSANWNLTAGATGYYLDVSTSNIFASFVTGYNNLDVSNVLTYPVTGLNFNGTYYYRLRAYNTYGCTSGNSNVIAVAVTPVVLVFRSIASGSWNSTSTWQFSGDGGANWISATTTPSSTDGVISVRNGHVVTVTTSVSTDQTTIDAGGQINVSTGQTLTIADGAGTDFTVNGTIINTGTMVFTGQVVCSAASIIEYNNSGAQSISDIASPGYGNLTLSNGNTKTAGGALDIQGNLTINTSTTFAGGTSLTHNIGGSWTNNGTFSYTTSSTINMNGSNVSAIQGSSTTAFNILTINKNSAVTTVTSSGNAFTVSNYLTVSQGNLVLQATDANYSVTNDLTVAANGTLTHSVYWDATSKLLSIGGNIIIDGIFDYTTRSHVQMTNTGTKTVKTGSNAASSFSILSLMTGTFNANGPLKVDDNFWAMFNTIGSFHTNGQIVTASAGILNAGGTFYIDGGTLNVTAGLSVGTGTNGAVVFSSGTLNADGVIIGNGTQTGTFSQTGGTANIGNLTINSTSGNAYTCTGAPAINITGTWTNNRSATAFSAASSTVTFKGTSPQTIGGTSSTTFNNLTINNASGVSLGRSSTVSTLTITSGILTTSGTNLLSVTNTASTAIAGGSATSFINGPVKWTLPASLVSGQTYNFPFGKGSTYLPFALVNPTTGTGTVTAQAEAFSANTGGTFDLTLISISTSEYWSLVTSGNFTNSSVSLTRQTAIAPLDVIGGSSTLTGSYTSLAGTAGTNGVTGSNAIGTRRFFLLAQKRTFATGTIIGSPFCAGTAVSVPFTANGTFNSGNIFTAQLSDASGNFASPIAIGSLTSTTAGTISATLPSNTLTGTGYRIRVVSSNPVLTGTDNGSNLIINTIPTVNAGPDQIKCKDSPVVTLAGSIGGGAASVTWTTSGTGSFNNSNSLTAEYAPSAADIAANSVTLTLTTDDPAGPCIAVSDFMVVSFIAAPAANAGNDGAMCTTSTTYAVSGSAANYSSISWTSSGTGYFTGGNTPTPVYTPSAGDIAAGSVTLTIHVTANTPCTNTSDAMVLTINQAAIADAGPDDYACKSGYLLSSSSVTNSVSFIWSRPAGTGEFDNPALLHPTFIPAVGFSGPVTLTLTATGNAPCSPSVNDIVLTVVNLPAPISADASAITTGGFTANWPPAVTGAEGYRLDVATDALFTSYVPGYQNLLVTGNSTTSYNVTGLSQSTDYWYRVRAEGHGCQSGNSDVIHVKTADASITITGVTGDPFDVGCSVTDNGTVTFTYDGSFNVGNNFIAQLSDNTGSFALPVNIGSASASPINIVIPANTPTGNGSYQIQLVSSDPSGVISLPSNVFTITNTPCPDAYQTKGSGEWNDYTIWEVNSNGGGWTDASRSPDYHDGTITILSGNTITVNAVVTVDQITVEAGGTLINAYNPLYAYYLKLANGTGDDLIVNGTIIANDYIENNTGATIKFEANSYYQHNLAGGKKSPASVNITTEIPTATWDPTSTCEILSVLGPTVTGLNQTFGNFIWNYPDFTVDLQGELTDIQGDFTIANSGGLTKLVSNPTGHRYLLTVGGNLDIQTGAVLELGGKQNLTVNGITTLADPLCLVLLSSADGTASFIDNGNVSGTVRIERYLTPYINQDPTDFRYHFLSSPVVNQPIQTEFVDLPNTINDFYAWNEGANLWINTKYESEPPYSWNPAFEDNFIQGKGYLVAYQDQQLKSFTGAPFTGSLTMSCTYGTGNGWNLLGNPFPSGLDWNVVLESKGNGMDDALYYYENFTPRYTYYIPLTGGIGTSVPNGSRYVPAMQGFMVHAKSTGTQTITMNNDARVHDGMKIYYKNSLLTQNVLNIHIDGNDSRDDARVCFYEPATLNFDGGYDAYKLFSYNTTIPELYSITNDNTNLAINTLPLSDMYGSVPLGFLPGIAGSFTFTAEGIENFPSTVYIKLEDKKTGIIQKLNDNPAYAFIASPDDDAKRFVLHFQDATSVDNTDKQNDFSVFNDNGTINIIALKAVSGHVNIIDMAGRKVGMAKLISGTPVRIDMKDHFGVYIVNIVTNQGIVNKKVVVN